MKTLASYKLLDEAVAAVWIALALLVGLIGSAVIGCQWISERVRK